MEMEGMSIALALAAIALILTVALLYSRNANRYWERRGVLGPKPWPLVGHLPEVLLGDRFSHERDWVNKYGKVHGIFYGREPRLMVADPDVLSQISVRDFEYFRNKEMTTFPSTYEKSMIIYLKDDHWKRVRSLMSPTFTSSKIRRMFKLMNSCAQDLIECFSEQLASGPVVNLKETYNLFTMDVISTCCYGLKLERAGSNSIRTLATRNDLVSRAMPFFQESHLRMLLGFIAPKFLLRLLRFEVIPNKNFEPLAEKVEGIIEARKKLGKKFDDYLQLLIDTRLDSRLEVSDLDDNENHHAGLTQESILKDQNRMVEQVKSSTAKSDLVLSDLEVLANGVFLLAVGLDTTGSLLTNCSHALAFHPEIQERLYQDLLSIVGPNEDKTTFEFTYEALTSCKYLDAVISETLRLLSPVVQMDRVASSDYTIEKYNLVVEKGQILNMCFYSIMHDPDYWPDCDKFDPERFMPENKDKIYPGSYCPFGLGPRHCLGMRFSLTESKLALAKIMMKFRFEPASGTKFANLVKGTIFQSNLDNPVVKLLPRN